MRIRGVCKVLYWPELWTRRKGGKRERDSRVADSR